VRRAGGLEAAGSLRGTTFGREHRPRGTRPSLSRDAVQLLFGRAGPTGSGDVYVTTRDKSED